MVNHNVTSQISETLENHGANKIFFKKKNDSEQHKKSI